jgi:hypothetical protein
MLSAFLVRSHGARSLPRLRFFLLPLICCLFLACPDRTPPPRDTTIYLRAEQVGVFSVRLRVSVADTSDPWRFGLARDDSLVLTATVTGADTVVRDAGLRPGHSYRYRAYWLKNSDFADSSAEVVVNTDDTTSHSFSWVIDTLGYDGNLNDVAIIDENNIWAVGYIRDGDSTYNAARWDGSEWEFYRIAPEGFFGTMTSIYAFSEDDIWFGKYGLPIHYNGTEFIKYSPSNGGHPGQPSIDAIWGTSSSDVYFVGGNGSIVYYDGTAFTRMESGTELPLLDIWGCVDEVTGETTILMLASNFPNAPPGESGITTY